ncbi:MAG: NADPH:quinone oxidoreductase family protein [Pseudomonadota bacterium]
MKAVVCKELGPPEKLAVMEVPTPQPAKGQVRIKVAACGVNYPDALIIEGKYQFRPDPPFTPGGEVAGTIDALGEGVGDWRIGQRVLALCGHGGFAEAVCVPAAQVAAIPKAMPFDEAAGFIMTYGTSHHALKQRAALQPGETLVVLGAAGGVGLTAVEIGRLMGARVIAAASSEDKLALAKAYGAEAGINYTSASLKQAIRQATGGRGADVIYDPVGGDLCEDAFRAIAWKGRYLVIGFTAGIPQLPTNLALLKGASLIGVFWGAFALREPDVHRANVAELLRWYEEGKLKPHISQAFPLDETGRAIRLLADRKAKGKVIVTLGSGS